MERERNGCGKNGKRCMAPCMAHKGYHLSVLRKGRSVAETEGNCLVRRAEACDIYEPGTESCLAGANVVLTQKWR